MCDNIKKMHFTLGITLNNIVLISHDVYAIEFGVGLIVKS